MLPEIMLPTLNGAQVASAQCTFHIFFVTGKVVDQSCGEEEDEEMFEEEEAEHSDMDKDAHPEACGTANEVSDPGLVTQETTTPSGEVTVEQSAPNVLKPDLSEIRKENNKDTMSYLKAKRINRHKSNESADAKKFKTSE